MGYNYIQVGDQSWGTRMATKPMSNIGPIAMPHQSVNDLYGLPSATLYTTMSGKHYPNYIVADHKGSARTPRTSVAPYLPTCPWKSYPLIVLKYSTGHTDVSEFVLHHKAVALQCAQQGGWWEFFALPKFFLSFSRTSKPSNSSHKVLQTPPPQTIDPTKISPSIGSPKMTSTSCRVINISPCGRWNVWVSGRHHSTRVDIRPWSISLDGALNNPSSPTNLIMSITQLSCIDIFAISLEWPRHSSGPESYKINKNYSGC